MAKFILDKVTIGSNSIGGTTGGGDIHNVVVEASLPTIEPNQVTVDNGQVINESYTVNLEMRTKNTKTGAANDGTAILSLATVSNDGTLHDKAFVRFDGTSNSFNIDSGKMFINGYEDYSNGRIETVLTGTLEVIKATDGLTSS
tara:strand:- start:254 stop:685 length:432 start_codon:yes stop_codon:yes gene_type:complete